ncbi:YciI family protein [Vallitalea guaymasensis]|uniref:YciI family protein n=1 Tax=Vallitalea guaymasensis TaxID=1185412 RepID=UPI000DE378B6|nr:YciI family protein [Vallitalea guaymasensis]
MKKDDRLFVRYDKKIPDAQVNKTDFNDHIKYLENVARERYFAGGGFEDRAGGMIVYEAENLEDAKEVADNDLLIKRGLYTYDLYQWKLVIVSDNQE